MQDSSQVKPARLYGRMRSGLPSVAVLVHRNRVMTSSPSLLLHLHLHLQQDDPHHKGEESRGLAFESSMR
jgi:hypothetical protein